MKRVFSVLLSIFIIISITTMVIAASSVPKSVIEATESVVRILAKHHDGDVTGSGFVVKSDRSETLVATNYHVVEDNPYNISVWVGENAKVDATIVAFSEQKDLCILRLSYPVSLQALSLSNRKTTQGDAIYAVGFPGAADYLSDKEAHSSAEATITDGIVSAVREATISDYGTSVKILQINAAINSGNSGGPLFNVYGEVVGINSLGIIDSQGIFGAIDVSELKDFMAANYIIVDQKVEFDSIVLISAFAVVLCIAVLLVVIFKKRTNRKTKATIPDAAEAVSLREHMLSYPNGLGENRAVALLMPIALKLRDMHNNGQTHLQVSPNSIFVKENGVKLASATSSEADRYASGYTAPEVYKGSSAGNLSDIYSFCAVLSYVVTGKHPENSLTRESNIFDLSSETGITSFEAIVNTGTALNEIERYPNMQDIILKLSPYNEVAFVEELVDEETKIPKEILCTVKQRKSKKATIAISIVGILLVLVALVGTYFGCYMKAKYHAKSGDFVSADKLLIVPAITKIHDAKLITYIDAGNLMHSGRFDEAKESFEVLSNYLNAEDMVLEADYRHAMQYADNNAFDIATGIMKALAEKKYRDAAEKVLEIKFRKASYLVYEEGKYTEALVMFTELDAQDYPGANEMWSETRYLWAQSLISEGDYSLAYDTLKFISSHADKYNDAFVEYCENLYLEGQRLYRNGAYQAAEKRFSCLDDYKDSDKYLTLLTGRLSSVFRTEPIVPEVEDLRTIFYFEDASEVLLTQEKVACYFLEGTWRSGSGNYYFKMEVKYGESSYSYDDSFKTSYNLTSYGGNFSIEDGIYKADGVSLFKFTLLTPNSMEVYCYKDGSTYTLHR